MVSADVVHRDEAEETDMAKRMWFPVAVGLLVSSLAIHAGWLPMVGASLLSGRGNGAHAGHARSGHRNHTNRRAHSRKGSGRSAARGGRKSASAHAPGHRASTNLGSTPTLSGSCYQVPDTIEADGSVDVTDQMNSFISSVPDRSCITFPAGATYWMEGTLVISGRTGLTIRGNGALIYAKYPGPRPSKPTSYRQHLRIEGSTSITVSDLRIRGPNTTCTFGRDFHAFEHGVMVGGSTDVLLAGLIISQTDGDGISIGDFDNNPSRDVSVHGGSIDCTGRQGVSFIDADTVAIRGVRIDRAPRSTFDLECDAPDQTISNVTLENNVIGSFGNMFLAAGGPGVERGVTVRGNVLTKVPLKVKIGTSDQVVNRFDFSLIGNKVLVDYHWTASAPIAAQGVSGFTVTGNSQPFDTSDHDYVMNLSGTCDVYAANNTVRGADGLWSDTSMACRWVDGGGNVF